MKKDTEITKVIFRKWSNGDIIAIFPEDPGTNPQYCDSYEHIGQHGSCDPYYLIGVTKLAKSDEYKDLKTELESIGYNLKVYQRYTYQMHLNRETNFYNIGR